MNPGNKATTDVLHVSAARLAAIHAKILELSGRVDSEWRRELIALRRQLQEQITSIAQLIEKLQADEGDMRKLRGALARMRSNVALHQANWPAVAIDRDDPQYQASVLAIRAANREFLALLRFYLTPSTAS